MRNLGGEKLYFLDGADLGQSPVLPEACVGAVSGPSNPDGQCILGGRRLRSGKCEATPIFAQTMVPYTTGTVAGVDYNVLKGMTKANQPALMANLKRPSSK